MTEGLDLLVVVAALGAGELDEHGAEHRAIPTESSYITFG